MIDELMPENQKHGIYGYQVSVNFFYKLPTIAKFLPITRSYCEALVNAIHITASVFINDDESSLRQDYVRWRKRVLVSPWFSYSYFIPPSLQAAIRYPDKSVSTRSRSRPYP